MKQPKKLIALLLTLVLAFGLMLPALAEGETEAETDPVAPVVTMQEEADPAMPIITVQPQGGRIRAGKNFSLSVEAHIPNGDEIGFRWRVSTGRVANTQTISIMASNPETYTVYVEVYNRSNPEYVVVSQTATVNVYYNVLDWIGVGAGVLLLPVTLPALFVFAGFWPGLALVAVLPQIFLPALWLIGQFQ